MDNFFFETRNNVKCNYTIIRLNKKNNYNERILKNTLQAYEIDDKDYISLEEIIEKSGEKLCKGISKQYILDEIENSDLVILSLSISPRKTRSKISAKKI